MKIIVCMKQVIDPEAPASTFKIDTEKKRAIPPEGSPPVLSPFDENALEAALIIKEQKGAEVIVISLGKKLSKPVLQKALAAGADDVILLQDDTFDNLDSYATANILSQAIKKIGEYNLILCGRQASDTNAGQVGIGIAEILDLPCITVAKKIEINDSEVMVEKTTYEGYEVIASPMPAVITANSEIGDLRLPTVKAVMASRRKEIPIWSSEELAVDITELHRTELKSLSIVGPREGKCTLIEGDDPRDAGEKLAVALKNAKVV